MTGWYSTFSEKNFPHQLLVRRTESRQYVPRVESAPATIESVYEDFTNLGAIFGVEDKARKHRDRYEEPD